MKNVFVKIFAVIMTVWYSMSIIGFDVHTCSGSGESFVVTFINGLTCQDIHPEHSCKTGACHADTPDTGCGCHHHEASSDCSFNVKSCCSNDYQVLSLTGTVSPNEHGHYDECGCGHCPCVGIPSDVSPVCFVENDSIDYIPDPDSGVLPAGERLAVLGVWRI